MAFRSVSIDIMHNVLIVTNGLTPIFIAKSLKFGIIRMDCFVRLEKAWFDKDIKTLS